MLGSNALFIAGGTAAFGLAVIPWALRQPTRTRTVIGVAYLCVYTFALVRAGVIPIQPVADTTQPELRILLQALQLFWWFVLLRCLVSLGRAFLLFHHKPRQRKFATDLLAGIVYLAGSFAVVGLVFALPVTGLLATSGVVAIVLGLALQSTVSDLFSGIALSIEGSYRVGDSIGLEGNVEGTVIEITWRATHIMTWAQDDVVVPNSVVAKSRVINYSYPVRVHGVSFVVSLDDRTPPPRAIEMLQQAIINCQGALRNPLPAAQASRFGASSIDYTVSFFVESIETAAQTTSDLLGLIYRHAAWAGIALTEPGEDVRVATQAEPRPYRSILDRMPLFDALSAYERDALVAALQRRELRDGEMVIEQKKTGGSLF